ncbi:PQQ-dependent sugar dehydrogenase [Methylopila henanensis]|uniref:PQQ-dependent sugar dehydrogenase n=1 Tax=Methylopila henanensis TaxID=873516 RepID=A0ABW4KCH6_9HYPH
MARVFPRALFAAIAAALIGGTALAATATEDFWSIGRPGGEAARRMAPVSAFPAPTPAEELPTPRLRAPPGFKVETFASDVLDARMIREGDRGTIFVSSLFVANRVYALAPKPGGGRELKVVLDDTPLPNGIEFHDGALYVATPQRILRFDRIEDRLDDPGPPTVIYDRFPPGGQHSWKSLRVGPDGKLYVSVNAPCNACAPGPEQGRIIRMNLDGAGVETVAEGVRTSVGFDFDPVTGDLWFTDNQRDWLSEDMPSDELNHVTKPGQHFGFPYCHSGIMTDPELGWGRSCDEFRRPAALLGPHMAPLGMRFYQGRMFPPTYSHAIFVARHGPWNRTRKDADVAVVLRDGRGRVISVEPFLTGFVQDNEYVGRPVDIHVMKDGSLLVSDDHNGAIYRVTYAGP